MEKDEGVLDPSVTTSSPTIQPVETGKVEHPPEKEEKLEHSYTVKEAAPLMFMSVWTLKEYLNDGTIHGVQLSPHTPGSHWRIDESEVRRVRKILKAGKSLHHAKQEIESKPFKPEIIDKTRPPETKKPPPDKEEAKDGTKKPPPETEEGWHYTIGGL